MIETGQLCRKQPAANTHRTCGALVASPNGGFDLGVERTIAWLCGLNHIRETTPFPRMMGLFYP